MNFSSDQEDNYIKRNTSNRDINTTTTVMAPFQDNLCQLVQELGTPEPE